MVRTVQPIIEELDIDVEEASLSLGANRWYTITRIIFPVIRPAIITGFALAFPCALGEYGSVVFIAGNMPMKTNHNSFNYNKAGAVRLYRSSGYSGCYACCFFYPFILNKCITVSCKSKG